MHTCVYTYTKKIASVDPNLASDFSRGNVPEREWAFLLLVMRYYLVLTSGPFYVRILIDKRETAHIFLVNSFHRTIVQPLVLGLGSILLLIV